MLPKIADIMISGARHGRRLMSLLVPTLTSSPGLVIAEIIGRPADCDPVAV
jgi:hypothetical protein